MKEHFTGRDGLIIATALYEFVRLQQSRPDDQRQWSDEQDAKAILLSMGNYHQVLADIDKHNGVTPPDLTDEKEHAVDEIDERAEREGDKLLRKITRS